MKIRLSAGDDPTRLSKPPPLAQQPSPGQPTEQLHHPAEPSGHRALAAEESRPFPPFPCLSEVLVSDGDLTNPGYRARKARAPHSCAEMLRF
jgi:hypothetical protein